MALPIRTIELKLVERANAGDIEAVGILYAMHAAWVTRLALRYTGSASDAEDVKHDTFIYLLSKFPGFSLRAPLRSFLFPAIRHRSYSVLRKRRRTKELFDDAFAAPPVSRSGDWERLLDLIPEHERVVVTRRFREGMSLAEIAGDLGIPIGTVKSRLHKALRRLRALLDRTERAA